LQAVAQHKGRSPGQKKAIATGEGNWLWSSFHTEPAVAAREHGEVRQVGGATFSIKRRRFFFGPFPLDQAPWRCRFQPVLTERGDVHRFKDVGYWIQYSLPIWTNGQNIWICRQFSSMLNEIYSSVRDATHREKEYVWES
jgi:hypothetical protein